MSRISSSINALLNTSTTKKMSVDVNRPIHRQTDGIEGAAADDETSQHGLLTPVSPAPWSPLQQRTRGTPASNTQEKPGFSFFALKPNAQELKKKPYACTECDHAFSRPHNLKSHLATHSTVRPFKCDACGHEFRRLHDLKRHQKLHTGERPYECTTCNRSFSRLDALNRHQKTENGSACQIQRSREASPLSRTAIALSLPENMPVSSVSSSIVSSEVSSTASSTASSASPAPQSQSQHVEMLTEQLAQVQQELQDIKEALGEKSNEAEQFKRKLHDLHIENRVLRSLVLDQKKRRTSESLPVEELPAQSPSPGPSIPAGSLD